MRTLVLKIENYEFEVPVFEKDGTSWVALRPICDILGVAYSKQWKKVTESSLIMCDLMVTHDTIGRKQEMLCVNIDHVGEWIFGINPNKVKPEIREKMILFRQKLQHVLYAAVTGHMDVNMVYTLVEEVKLLKEIVRQQGEIINHLMIQNQLNNQYVDKQLASVGGKLLSNLSQKKRKLMLVV